MKLRHLLGILLILSSGCQSPSHSRRGRSPSNETNDYKVLNLTADSDVLYEVQVRSANACIPTVGSATQQAACAKKIAPQVIYRAENMTCDPDHPATLQGLQSIKLGTVEDMLVPDAPDFRSGITLRYIQEKVGANTVWLMPIFPNNDTWKIPDPCDNLGSPYAVRDYMHASGMISQACIAKGSDEHSNTAPCWGNASIDALIAQAHSRGLKVMLDVAFNHFGHNYLMYDYTSFTSVRDLIAQGTDLNSLWNYGTQADAPSDPALVHPEILDSLAQLQSLASQSTFHKQQLAALQAKCPGLQGQDLVRAYAQWRNALDWERAQMDCSANPLEFEVPGFYLGSNAYDPSTHIGDNFTNNWTDVKFLAHHEENVAHQYEFVRNREYLFRVLNYWASRGIDGFRLDHTTDPQGGMSSNEWKYILGKVDYYAGKRGQKPLIYMAEEFGADKPEHHGYGQMPMSHVVDAMTEGYIFNMRNPTTKDTSMVEGAVANNDRFGGHMFVMTALEDHDEESLLKDTGFDIWTGSGFWGVGLTTWSLPMMLMGQELGEPFGLGFRKSSLIRSRFQGSGQDNPQSDKLLSAYHQMITARLQNPALTSQNRYFLRPKPTPTIPDSRIFAVAKWSGSNVVFAFHNLWNQSAAQTFDITGSLAGQIGLNPSTRYQLFDLVAGAPAGGCFTGQSLQDAGLIVIFTGGSSAPVQWLRLDPCSTAS